MYTLNGRTALVTGASAGIGKAIAKRFAVAGARLILLARREDGLRRATDDIAREFGVEMLVRTVDVRDRAAVDALFEALPADWASIDVLVNNAGLARSTDPVYGMNPSDVDDMIDTNVKGLLNVTNMVVPGMIERGRGHVINIGSTAGHEVYKGGVVYSATKHAVGAITRGLKIELHGTPVRVSTVDPGMVETDFSLVRFHGDADRAAAVYAGTRPLRPEDVADAVLYCATRPERVNISEIIMMTVDQSSASLVHRTPPNK